MRIAVTGAAGYLGSALCAALGGTADLVAVGHMREVGRLRSAVSGSMVIHECEIQDEAGLREAFSGVDVVFHLAAITGEQHCLEDPVRAALTNVVGTAAVVDAARTAGVARLVFASSFWVYSVYRRRRMPLAETDPPMTDTFYGALKLAGERIVGSLPVGLTVRLSNVYGFGAGAGAQWDGFVGRSIRAALRGEPIRLYGDGHQGLELLHVDDAVARLRALAEPQRPQHRVYNLGAGRVTEVAEVAETIATLVERTGRTRPPIERVAAPAGKIWPDRWLDVSRIEAEVGPRPQVSLTAGLGELVERSIDLDTTASGTHR